METIKSKINNIIQQSFNMFIFYKINIICGAVLVVFLSNPNPLGSVKVLYLCLQYQLFFWILPMLWSYHSMSPEHLKDKRRTKQLKWSSAVALFVFECPFCFDYWIKFNMSVLILRLSVQLQFKLLNRLVLFQLVNLFKDNIFIKPINFQDYYCMKYYILLFVKVYNLI